MTPAKDLSLVYGPVIILGGSRTGSETIKHIIRSETDIAILDEAHILNPSLLHPSVYQVFKKSMKVDFYESIWTDFLEVATGKALFGELWKGVEEKIDSDTFDLHWVSSRKSAWDFLMALMLGQAAKEGKLRFGAKFPVHISMLKQAREAYPNGKFVLTIRDPRAVLYSQKKKHGKSTSKVKRHINILAQILHITLQQRSILRQFKSNEDVYLLKYEDLISNPERTLRSLMNFVGAQYKVGMLTPKKANSSFQSERVAGQGFNEKSMYKWKAGLSAPEKIVMSLLNRGIIKTFGYES